MNMNDPLRREEKKEVPVFDTSSKHTKKDFGEFKFGE